jgi:methylated-DNA-[protein]-cysteine S-methyltransferase
MTAPRQRGGDLFAALPAIDDAANARLHDLLVARAARGGVLDIAYRTIDTSVGRLLLAATPRGLVRVAFDCEGHERALASIAAALSPRILRAPGRLDDAAREIEEYLAGARRRFDLPLDFSLARGFRREVLRRLQRIAYGRTASYAAIAAAAGSPRAVRAVGTACATNPLPLVVPCHRVVRSDGTIGQYAGGAGVKQALLAMEGAPETP